MKVGQVNQYDEVAQRINRLLHEAAQKGHVEIAPSRPLVSNASDQLRSEDFTAQPLACEYLTPREVASKLNLSTDTVYTMLREGELPAIRLGAGKRQVWRIPVLEFRRYLDAIRTGPELR